MAAQAGDVYAFGVLLWELAAGQAMFAGMPWAQVMAAVTLRHSRPRLPPGRALPSGLEPVVRMCMAMLPADRPSFHDVRLAPPSMPSTAFQVLSFTHSPSSEDVWNSQRLLARTVVRAKGQHAVRRPGGYCLE